ncbi:MAG TPA: PxKF domain-containing protein, partial [Chthoniobacterales bacterium]|nr:PxKF domain-containing protein [Chthoniobacterales bacterium]
QSSDPSAVINEDVVSTTPDTAFRWTGDQWIFNISTKGMKAGIKYTYQITLNDGSSIVFSFALK